MIYVDFDLLHKKFDHFQIKPFDCVEKRSLLFFIKQLKIDLQFMEFFQSL